MSYRPRLRSAVIGACTAVLLAGTGLLALPAQAESPRAPASSARMSTRPEMQVMTFVGYYKDAVNGQHAEGKSPADVRKEYLAAELDGTLYDWGSDHQKDPVFRVNELPESWSAAGEGAGGRSRQGRPDPDLRERHDVRRLVSGGHHEHGHRRPDRPLVTTRPGRHAHRRPGRRPSVRGCARTPRRRPGRR